MSSCCGPTPNNVDRERFALIGRFFAKSVGREYAKKGLSADAERMVDFLAGRGIEGASVLEIGGGIGEIQLELLKRGASRTENLELSDAYEDTANQLIEQAGMEGSVSRRLWVDIAETPDAVGPADVVVLHRVVCCYPDYERLLSAAASHAKRAIVFSYPPRNWFNRVGFAATNAVMRVMRKTYRAYAHDPAAMIDVVRQHGLEPTYSHQGLGFCISGAVRAA